MEEGAILYEFLKEGNMLVPSIAPTIIPILLLLLIILCEDVVYISIAITSSICKDKCIWNILGVNAIIYSNFLLGI